MIAANIAYADKQPTMPVEVITRDAHDTATIGHELVPILMILFLVLSQIGGSDYTMMVVSDDRLKTDIVPVGISDNGLSIYEYRYVGMDGRFRSVLAQEVLTHTPEAVVTHPSGFYMVNYGLLGMQMERVE